MIPHDLFYQFPNAAWAFILLPIYLSLFLVVWYKRKSLMNRWGEGSVQDQSIIPRNPTVFWGKSVALLISWGFAVVALMQPMGNGHYPDLKNQQGQNRAKTREILLLVDASASMGVSDARGGTTRLEQAKDIAEQLVRRLQGNRLALDVFTAENVSLSPFTLDSLFVRIMIRTIEINEGEVSGTNFTEVMKAVEKKIRSRPDSILKTLIILSDGEDLPQLSSNAKGEAQYQNILSVVEHLEQRGVQVITIGFGTVAGGEVPNVTFQKQKVISHLNESLLKQIARVGRGSYFTANDLPATQLANQVVQIIDERANSAEGNWQTTENAHEYLLYDSYFYIPLIIAILTLGWAIIWPDSSKKIVSLIIFLYAPLSLFSDEMAVAARSFEAEDYVNAENIYNTFLDRKLSPWQNQVVIYNLGCAQLAMGENDLAIESFKKLASVKNLHPLLKERVLFNATIAILKSAQATDNLQNSLYKAHEGFELAQQTAVAECVLNKAKGAEACKNSSKVNQLSMSASLYYFHQLAKLQNDWEKQLEVSEKMALILAGLRGVIHHAGWISDLDLDEELKRKYGSILAAEANSWENLNGESKNEALPLIKRGITQAQQGNFREAVKEWNNAIAVIERIEASANMTSDKKEKIKRLVNFFSYALLQVPLQNSTLMALQDQAKNMKSVSQQIEKGLSLLRSGDRAGSRFALEVGKKNLTNIYRKMNQKKEVTPDSFLKNLIEDQEYVLLLNQIRLDPFRAVVAQEEEEKEVSRAQEKIVKRISVFFDFVQKVQSQVFQGIIPSKNNSRCQEWPWIEVIPHFAKGGEWAKEALITLRTEHQEEALRSWREAFKSLNKPFQPSKSHCRGASKQEQKKREDDKTKSDQSEEKMREKVIKELLDMDAADRTARKRSAGLGGVEGLW